MKLRELKHGTAFNNYAMVLDDGSCPAGDFLIYLKQQNLSSFNSLLNILLRHANNGVIKNKTKSRAIKGKKNLWEFKSTQGDRLLYFYIKGGMTVLTHGFHKGVPAHIEYDRAENLRDRYLLEINYD